MKTIAFLLVLVLAVAGVCVVRAGGVQRVSPYNAKVAYRQGEPLAFRDFALTYQGETKANPPKGLHAWTIYHFVVKTPEGKEQKVSWSAGTGDIGPTAFQVGARRFLLELMRSDTLGKLQESELVIRETGSNR